MLEQLFGREGALLVMLICTIICLSVTIKCVLILGDYEYRGRYGENSSEEGDCRGAYKKVGVCIFFVFITMIYIGNTLKMMQ